MVVVGSNEGLGLRLLQLFTAKVFINIDSITGDLGQTYTGAAL